MATVTIKDLPERLHRRLKSRAAAHGRSLNREIIACLEAAAGATRIDPEALLARAESLRRRVSGHLTDSDLAAFRAAGRP
jgi:plasmid stability protein